MPEQSTIKLDRIESARPDPNRSNPSGRSPDRMNPEGVNPNRADRFKVKKLGHIVEDGEMLWLISSGAEISFRVWDARHLYFRLRADDTVLDSEKEPQLPRFAVRMDGQKVMDARMTATDAMVTIFNGSEKLDTEIRLIKLSEGTQSLMALREIITDGQIEPLPPKKLKIEFIGDSITCGFGVEGKSEEEPFTTATENAEKAYALLTAQALDADAVLTCFSGHGIVSGYTDDPAVQNTTSLVPPWYEKECHSDFRLPSGRTAGQIRRDFSAFQPDYIVVNLGTNDLSWCKENSWRCGLFQAGYVYFLKMVRRNNPKARILCTLGLMGTGLNSRMQAAAEEYCRETGDGQIRLLMLEEQNAARDGYGSLFHPNEITQRLMAGKVTEAIRTWMRK